MKKGFLKIVLIWSIVITIIFSQSVLTLGAVQDDTVRDIQYLMTVMEMIKEKYGGQITDEQLIEGALRGMFSTMDPYTGYISKDEADDFFGDLNGTYEGIGITMEKKDAYIWVTKVFDGSPADKAGVFPGDRIVSVDGVDVTGASIEDAGSMIKGPAGAAVVLGVTRGSGNEIKKISVTRGKVLLNPVSYKINGDIGYIRIDIFNTYSSTNFEKALNEMDRKSISKIILDLRGNPGGDVSEAVAIAMKLVPKGLITKLDFKSESMPDIEYYSTLKNARYKLAVLVNGMSASAAEILAGAIQDTGTGVLIGTNTFGKAKVQNIIPLLTPDAYEKYSDILGIEVVDAYDLIYVHGIMPLDSEIIGYTKITTGLYTTPKGRMIDEKGLKPDIIIADPKPVNGIDINSIELLKKRAKPELNGESADVYYAEKILKAKGYDIDSPDSKLDKRTFDIIKEIQKEKGGYPHGGLDFTTQQWLNDILDELLLENDKQYAKAVETLGTR